MKNNLYVYACSHGKFGTPLKDNSNNQHTWTDNFSWGSIVADKLELNFVNRSMPGCSNFHIFESILHDIEKNILIENDYVIVQWTHIDRAYMISKNSIKTAILPNNKSELAISYYSNLHSDLQNLSNIVGYTTYLKDKIKSRFYYSFSDYVSHFQNISLMLSNDMISSSKCILKDNKSPRETLLEEFYRSKNNNLLFPCSHAAVLGHKFIADIYLDFISSTKYS